MDYGRKKRSKHDPILVFSFLQYTALNADELDSSNLAWNMDYWTKGYKVNTDDRTKRNRGRYHTNKLYLHVNTPSDYSGYVLYTIEKPSCAVCDLIKEPIYYRHLGKIHTRQRKNRAALLPLGENTNNLLKSTFIDRRFIEWPHPPPQ